MFAYLISIASSRKAARHSMRQFIFYKMDGEINNKENFAFGGIFFIHSVVCAGIGRRYFYL